MSFWPISTLNQNEIHYCFEELKKRINLLSNYWDQRTKWFKIHISFGFIENDEKSTKKMVKFTSKNVSQCAQFKQKPINSTKIISVLCQITKTSKTNKNYAVQSFSTFENAKYDWRVAKQQIEMHRFTWIAYNHDKNEPNERNGSETETRRQFSVESKVFETTKKKRCDAQNDHHSDGRTATTMTSLKSNENERAHVRANEETVGKSENKKKSLKTNYLSCDKYRCIWATLSILNAATLPCVSVSSARTHKQITQSLCERAAVHCMFDRFSCRQPWKVNVKTFEKQKTLGAHHNQFEFVNKIAVKSVLCCLLRAHSHTATASSQNDGEEGERKRSEQKLCKPKERQKKYRYFLLRSMIISAVANMNISNRNWIADEVKQRPKEIACIHFLFRVHHLEACDFVLTHVHSVNFHCIGHKACAFSSRH